MKSATEESRSIAAEGSTPPLVLHLIYELSQGGLEAGLINLINHMPTDRYRHAIVCMADYSDFRNRLTRSDVPVIALHKRAGQDWATYWRLYMLLRQLRPDILHTRTWSGLEGQIYGALARVPGRVHSEHGYSMKDSGAGQLLHKFVRRAINPLVGHYTAVSEDLVQRVMAATRVSSDRVTATYNGVDARLFHPRRGPRGSLGPAGFAPDNTLVIGTIGRMDPVKDQLTLVRAFLCLLDAVPDARSRLRLVLIGDGPQRSKVTELIRAGGAESITWIPGERGDIPEIMRALDVFVLPSLAEGMSNTILEAMASGLPVLGTRVGGNVELVQEGRTGMLVPAGDAASMAAALRSYIDDPTQLVSHGSAARRTAEARFSLEGMVERYVAVYDAVLRGKTRRSEVAKQ